MAQLTRHQIGASLLAALRQEGLGVRDLFDGRQEPVSWFFRCLAYDQSELDIMESGAIDTLYAPSALVELSLDEVALAGTAIGAAALASYLSWDETPDEEEVFGGTEERDEAGAPPVGFHPSCMLGYLTADVAPPALWLEERDSDPDTNELLARRLALLAQEVGSEADAVEVHIEGALDASQEGWADRTAQVRPAGVSVHFTFDIRLAGTGEPELAHIFSSGARTARRAIETMRRVFERLGGGGVP